MAETGMYWARQQFLEAVHGGIIASLASLQKEVKDMQSLRLDPIPVPLPTLFPGASLTRFKAAAGAALDSDDSTANAAGLRGCYDRLKRVASTQPSFATRFTHKELLQIDQVVEGRIRFWCGLSGIIFPTSRITPQFGSSSAPAGSTSQVPAAGLFSVEDEVFSLQGVEPFASGLTSVATAAAPSSTAPNSLLTAASTRKKKGFAVDKPGLHEVGKESLLAAPLILPDVMDRVAGASPEWNLAIFLQHPDTEVAIAASHAMQSAVVSASVGRAEIIRQLVSSIVCHITIGSPLYAPMATTEDNALCSLVCHLLLLLDLWALTTKPSDVELDYDFAGVFDEVEAIGVVSLCDSSPFVRLTALSILSSVQTLRESHNVQNQSKGFLWLLQQHNSDIVQRARFALILHLAGGISDKVNLPAQLIDKDALRIEHCAYSRQELLWTFILSEMMGVWVDHQLSIGPGASQVLRMVRHVGVYRLEIWRSLALSEGAALASIHPWVANSQSSPSLRNCSLPLPPFALNNMAALTSGAAANADGGFVPTNLFASALSISGGVDVVQRCMINLPLVHRHTHAMIFSAMACIPSALERRAEGAVDGTLGATEEPLSEYEQYVYDLCKTEQTALHKYFSAYLTHFVAGLLNGESDRCLADALVVSASRSHWRAIKLVVCACWKLLVSLSAKKTSRKRQKARTDVSNLLRRMCSSQGFVRALQLDCADAAAPMQLVRTLLYLVDDACTFAPSAYSKTPTLQISDYLVGISVIVQRLLGGLEQLSRTGVCILCPQQGPLRQFLNPSQNRSILSNVLSSQQVDAGEASTLVDWRSLADLFQSCLGFGKLAAFRRNMDETEVRVV